MVNGKFSSRMFQSLQGMQSGDMSCHVETLKVFEKIALDEKNARPLNAMVCLMEDSALKRATLLDSMSLKQRENLKLFGLPIIMKDNFHIKGVETTCASKMLEGYIALFSATVCSKLQDAGAVLIGKSNMDEFAMGSSNEYSAQGPVRNVHNRDNVSGGSSGGSSVAVAADWVSVAFGTDTGGSVRQPACLCGIVGFKPTYGRISRYGVVPLSCALDHVGILTRNIEDVALVLEVVAGHDEKDSTSSTESVDAYVSGLKNDIAGKRVAVIQEHEKILQETFPSLLKYLEQAKQYLRSLGCVVKEVSIETVKLDIPVYYILVTSDLFSNLARFDGVRYGKRIKQFESLHDLYFETRHAGFGEEVIRRLLSGAYFLSKNQTESPLILAHKLLAQISQKYQLAFQETDLLLVPSSPNAGFKIGATKDPVSMYLSDMFTAGANLCGLPAVNLPVDKDKEGNPVGIQLVGNQFQEMSVLNVSWHLQEAFGYIKN